MDNGRSGRFESQLIKIDTFIYLFVRARCVFLGSQPIYSLLNKSACQGASRTDTHSLTHTRTHTQRPPYTSSHRLTQYRTQHSRQKIFILLKKLERSKLKSVRCAPATLQNRYAATRVCLAKQYIYLRVFSLAVSISLAHVFVSIPREHAVHTSPEYEYDAYAIEEKIVIYFAVCTPRYAVPFSSYNGWVKIEFYRKKTHKTKKTLQQIERYLQQMSTQKISTRHTTTTTRHTECDFTARIYWDDCCRDKAQHSSKSHQINILSKLLLPPLLPSSSSSS